jgi:hypothetical protein
MITEIITGNFTARIEGDLDETAEISVGSEENPRTATVRQVVDESGITYIVQRDGLSAVYKGLLDKGQKRNTLEFSDETASKFKTALEKALSGYGSFAVEVTEHVPTAEASPMVRATALVDAMLANPELESGYRLAFGAQGLANANNAGRDDLIAFAHKLGLGIQPPRGKKS